MRHDNSFAIMPLAAKEGSVRPDQAVFTACVINSEQSAALPNALRSLCRVPPCAFSISHKVAEPGVPHLSKVCRETIAELDFSLRAVVIILASAILSSDS